MKFTDLISSLTGNRSAAHPPLPASSVDKIFDEPYSKSSCRCIIEAYDSITQLQGKNTPCRYYVLSVRGAAGDIAQLAAELSIDAAKLSADKANIELGRWAGMSEKLKTDLYKLRNTMPELSVNRLLGHIEDDRDLHPASAAPASVRR